MARVGRKGKYEEWLSEDKLTILTGWARDGLTDEQIAHNIGINRATLYEWKNRFPDIANALKNGKEVVDYLVENALYKSALSGNVTAIIFWLKNRKPNKWRDKPEIDETEYMEDSGLIEALNDQAKSLFEDGDDSDLIEEND